MGFVRGALILLSALLYDLLPLIEKQETLLSRQCSTQDQLSQIDVSQYVSYVKLLVKMSLGLAELLILLYNIFAMKFVPTNAWKEEVKDGGVHDEVGDFEWLSPQNGVNQVFDIVLAKSTF